MKKLLFILFMIPILAFGQTKIKINQGDTSSVGFATNAKLGTYLTKAQILALGYGDTTVLKSIVSSIGKTATLTTLAAYSGSETTILVTSSDGTGGLFLYSSSGTSDGGVVVTATGKGSGYWKRQFNPGDGVRVAWWGDTFAAIQSAITYAGVNGKIIFTPNKTYLQTAQLSPLAGQVWQGNNATLQRQTETTTTISGTVLSSATSFTVASVPATWHVNDYIQIYTSQDVSGASNMVQIAGISGTTITLYGAIGAALVNSAASYASGSGIYKVWHQIYDNTLHVNFELDNLNFDGNSSTSAVNVYWAANNAIDGSAVAIRVIGCSFINMGNDCIDGQGLYVTGCTYKNLNNSFIHLSTDFSISPATYPSTIFGNKGFNSNLVASATGSHHSEGVITLSFTSGYCNIYDNWFSGGLDAVLGQIQMGATSTSGGTRYMRFHHNQCFGFTGIIKSLSADGTETTKPGIIMIDGNTFSNCGTTSPFPSTLSGSWAYYDKITWANNDLCDGTTITLPAEVYTTTSIANTNGTANIQTGAAVNVDGNITAGGNLSVTGTSALAGNINVGGAANTTESLGIHKNITGGTTAYSTFQDGAIQSGVTSTAMMSYSKPSTQATSFTLGALYHLFLGGVTVGSGSAVTNQYGVYMQSTFNTATNNYGVYGNAVKSPGVWFLYNASTADSYSAGNYGFHLNSSISAYAHFGAGTATASTAPLKFTTGVNLTTPEAGAVEYDGNYFYGTNTAAKRGSFASVYASNDLTAQTAAGNITTFTVGATTQTFDVSMYINITAVSVDVIQGQITYTDETNTGQTISLANLPSAIGPSAYNPITIRAKNGTVITVKTNLTTGAGSITFNCGGRITQL